MPNDRGVPHESLDICLGELGNFIDIKFFETTPEIFTLIQNRAPRQTTLKSFKTQLLKESRIVGSRKSPFGVVIVRHQPRR